MSEPASNIRNIPYKDIYEDLEKRVEELEKEKGSSGGGGNMEARVAGLESDITDIKVHIASIDSMIGASFPNFATKEDIAATKADIADTKADIAKAETSIIKWIVGTMLASAGLAATIAFGMAKLIQ